MTKKPKTSDNKKILSIVIRYSLLLVLGLNLWIFYSILAPVTIYPVYWILNLFYSASLEGSTIILDPLKHNINIEIIKACVAGSAYYLLSALSLAMPLNFKKQIKLLTSAFILFLLINLIRILSFSFIGIYNEGLFEVAHMLFWYFISTLIVVFVWFFLVKTFQIKEIPFYTDFKFLFSAFSNNKKISKKKTKKRKKKSKK